MPWSKLHVLTLIPTLVIEIIMAFFIGKCLSNKSNKAKMLPFKFIAVLLTFMEIIKQIVSIKKGYDLYHLPLHFCSLFIFLLPLHAFYNGKHRGKVNLLMLTCSASLLFVMLICPNVIYSEEAIKNFTNDYIDSYSIIFHGLVSFYYMLMLFIDEYKFNTKKDIKILFMFFTIYILISAPLAQILQTNFHNLYKCGIPFIENFRIFLINKLGWIAQLIYIIGMYIATIGVNVFTYTLSKKVNMLLKK